MVSEEREYFCHGVREHFGIGTVDRVDIGFIHSSSGFVHHGIGRGGGILWHGRMSRIRYSQPRKGGEHLMDMAGASVKAFDEDEVNSLDTLRDTGHRPFPMPDRPWTMTQRWNDLLFAHWPIAVETMAALIPEGLEVDVFDGYAWVGVVPFWMSRIRARVPGMDHRRFPFSRSFPELNLRTYVRSKRTGRAGVFFFALEAASPVAVAGARTLFHLPYFLANMSRTTTTDGTVRYKSRRLLTSQTVGFQATYRGLGRNEDVQASQPGSLEHFLTERYCLFTTHSGAVLVGNIHHKSWPLEAAEAEMRTNDLPRAHGLTLPNRPPVLHFSKSLDVYIWALRRDGFPLNADGSV